jgi:DNA-binding SARP family transcriptional activator
MEFRILGPLEVVADGQILRLGGPKQRALLALLLTQANRAVSIDRLSEGLWGDAPPNGAAATIQVYISQLRKQLEPNRKPNAPYRVLVSQPPGYLLRVGPDQLDLYRFEQFKDAAFAALTAGDAEAAATSFRQAIAVWRGPALADFAAEPWALGEAGRMNEMRLQALEQRIEADLVLGRHAHLTAELETIVAEYPFRERLRGQLMVALYRSGRQAEASDVFHRTREKLVEELGMEPGPDLQKLLKQILNQDPSLEVRPRPLKSQQSQPHNLPVQLTSFVGRDAELGTVKRLISESRLVTLTGAGGIGKTRLALEVARQVVDQYRDGAWLVELAPLANPELVPNVVLAALGFGAQPSDTPTESLISALAVREMLCLLDNCEHLLDACARLTDALLRSCPQLRILATSRELLGVSGETTWRVPSMATPDSSRSLSLEELQGLETVQLFVQRADAARPGFQLTRESAGAAARICQRLDGIPLAIELAAARMRALHAEQIAERLDNRFQLLTGGSRTALPRQQTLRALIDWS